MIGRKRQSSSKREDLPFFVAISYESQEFGDFPPKLGNACGLPASGRPND
jgi:hypothetical protein